MLARWAALLCFLPSSSISTHPEKSGEDSRTECNPVQHTAMGKETETKTETSAGLTVSQDDSVAPVALPRRRFRAGFAARNQNERSVRVFSFCYHLLSFRTGGERLVDRPNPFSYLYLRRMANPGLGGGALRDLRRRDSGSERRDRGRGFGFVFGPMARDLDRGSAFP